MRIGPRALMLALQRFHSRLTPEVLPGGAALIGEETRRNKPDFDFIVENKLFEVSGLRAAYRAAKRIAFPDDSIEVKANWVEGRLREFNGFAGSSADARAAYHVDPAGGKSTLSSHFTSHPGSLRTGPGRLSNTRTIRADATFWAARIVSARKTHMSRPSPRSSSEPLPRLRQSPALLALFARAHIDPAFLNYCLKALRRTSPIRPARRSASAIR